MRLIGQRWRYRIGNWEIDVDNGFSRTLWGQERLRMNGEDMRSTGGRLRLFQSWAEPWLTPLGDGMLSVALSSKANGIACRVKLDGEEVEPEALFEARWSGAARQWPQEQDWIETRTPRWIAGLRRST